MAETRDELDQTLGRLEAIWDDIGLTEEQRKERRHHFNIHIVNLCEKIIDDETALKTRITNNIERNTQEILRLSEGLGIVPEDAVEGLTLLELDTLLQERVDHLLQLKEQRMEKLKLLQEKDEGLCELLCETPYYIPAGLIPSLDDMKSVEEHVKSLEAEKEEREKTFRLLKAGLLNFLEVLEQSPEDTLCQDIICSDDDDVPLGKAYLQQLRSLHSDLEFRVHENEAKSLELRENINRLWIVLEIPIEEQEAFLATAPKHTPSNISKLEEEYERLKLLRLQNLSVFIEKLQEELANWWEKCYVGEEERQKFLDLQPDDANEEVLEAYEGEVCKWKKHFEANQEIYILITQFMDLYNHMLELEERAKDPSRLFNTRGGALLQEEKAKKKVRTELPRVQESLLERGRLWAEREGQPFHIRGAPLEDYIRVLWESYDTKKEAEKNKRQSKTSHEVKRPTVLQPKTPATVAGSKKRLREGDEVASAKKLKPGGTSLFKSPSKSTLRSPTKTPRTRPLTERNNQQPSSQSSSADTSLHSTISYDKFEAGIDQRGCEEIIHSSLMADPPHEKNRQHEDHLRTQRLKETLNLASPQKAHSGSKGTPRISGFSSDKGALRRFASQPSLRTKNIKPLSQKLFSNKAHPVHFLI